MGSKIGKPVLSFCVGALTFFSIVGLYKFDLLRFVPTNANYKNPPIAYYASERNTSEEEIKMQEPNGETSVLQYKLPCYRQVQVWDGSTSPQTPQKSECPGLECGISYVRDRNVENMMRSDAIVWFHRSSWNWAEMQKIRPLNQAWVFYSLESPRHTGGNAVPPSDLDRIYNYTISYRPSSTIHGPYGLYDETVPQISPDENRNWAKEKSGLIAWAASNCGVGSWRRLQFVRTLSTHVSVDMYGPCGNKACDRYSDDCWKKIGAHKFYLALENSECRDYITEKLWFNSFLHDLIPIVYGAPREDYERVAPPNSFIHLQDFKNFGELADYIHLLDSNDTLYNSYFEWKKTGSVRRVGEGEILNPPFLCKVVAKVLEHEKNLNIGHNVEEEHPSMHEYWSTSCISPNGFPHDF